MKKNLIVVGGPTASGKTSLAIDLALHFETEIISADSRQLFRELVIGTAAPTAEEQATVKHHFIGSHSVADEVTAASYAHEAGELISNLFEKYDTLILVGGSGLYIDAVIHGIDDLPEADTELRSRLQQILKVEGLIRLQEMLRDLDPVTFSKIDIMNPRRLIRALEVTIGSGIPYSSQLNKQRQRNEWNITMTGILHPRELLYEKINRRTEKMIEQGLLEETQSMLPFRKHNALRTVGYKEMFMHIDGEITLSQASNLIAQHTRNYAKRQMTWFRKYPDMIWISPGDTALISKLKKI